MIPPISSQKLSELSRRSKKPTDFYSAEQALLGVYRIFDSGGRVIRYGFFAFPDWVPDTKALRPLPSALLPRFSLGILDPSSILALVSRLIAALWTAVSVLPKTNLTERKPPAAPRATQLQPKHVHSLGPTKDWTNYLGKGYLRPI
jgi:hypothetical protein